MGSGIETGASDASLTPIERGLAKLAVERETYNLMEQYKTGLVNETIRVPTGDDERISLATLPDGPVVVIIRHGKTEHNKLGLFTGWEDAPLADDGREEARSAGRLLRDAGISFDVVYTSWLSRAIETAWLVLDEVRGGATARRDRRSRHASPLSPLPSENPPPVSHALSLSERPAARRARDALSTTARRRSSTRSGCRSTSRGG